MPLRNTRSKALELKTPMIATLKKWLVQWWLRLLGKLLPRHLVIFDLRELSNLMTLDKIIADLQADGDSLSKLVELLVNLKRVPELINKMDQVIRLLQERDSSDDFRLYVLGVVERLNKLSEVNNTKGKEETT